MMNSIILTLKFIGRNFGKLGLVVFAIGAFFILLFPLGDLSDFVSTKVLQNTRNSVYVQFKDLSFNPVTMTLKLEDVEIDSPVAQEMKVGVLTASPSIIDLISKKPSGTIVAESFLGGTTRLEIKSQNAFTESPMVSNVSLSMDQVSLEDIHKLLQTSVALSGQLQVQTQVSVELENVAPADQPPQFALKGFQDGDLLISIKKFKMPATTITVPQMGRLGLPLVELNNVELKAKMQQGKITIESGKFGSPSDEMFGTIKGDLSIVNPIPPGLPLQMMFQSYNITLEITAKQAFKERAALFLAFLKEVDKDPSGLSRYQQTFSYSGMGLPPNR